MISKTTMNLNILNRISSTETPQYNNISLVHQNPEVK